jgi:hypothetical protein
MMTLAQIEMHRWVVGCGCGDVSGTGHAVSGTVGQAAIGELSGPSFIHEIGFWYGPQPMTGAVGCEGIAPLEFSFGPAYPNPFNPRTSFQFSIPKPCYVSIRLYDVRGREVMAVVDRELEPGVHTQVLHADGLSSGVYFCRMEAGRFVQNRKLVLLK